MVKTREIADLAIDCARESGKFLLDNFGKVNSVQSKGDRNFFTDIDKKAEELIVSRIKKAFPSHGILAEEGSASNSDSEYLWIIDPLDGTHNYIRSVNVFGVSIGVVCKGEFFAGAICMPCENELYHAVKGEGAYKNGKKISVSSGNTLKECSLSFDSAIRYSPKKMIPVLNELAENVFNIRMCGSSARVLSHIAEGKLDAAVEFHDEPWDFAAGVCLITEAGGRVSGLDGSKLYYDTDGYIASNGFIHQDIKDIVCAHL